MRTLRILVVDDDAFVLKTLAKALAKDGAEVSTASDGNEAAALARETPFDLVFTDLKMPGMDGIEVLKAVKALRPAAEVIVITGYGTVETAVEALKQGAYDYVTKPIDFGDLRAKVAEAAARIDLGHNVQLLDTDAPETPVRFGRLVGSSQPMSDVYRLIEKVAGGDCSVLIEGESGTGKELVAREVHQRSRVAGGPFVAVDCGALPESVVERELFGHEKGAYTGAHEAGPGYFEAADGGVLFLDEIANLGIPVQAKLLRVLETGALFRIGRPEPVRVNVRVLAATNQDLRKLTEQGAFREDLYYRINVVSIRLPPLRERGGDVLLLAHFFLRHLMRSNRLPEKHLSKQMEWILKNYSWPGNVRELENVIHRAVTVCESDVLTPADLPEFITSRWARGLSEGDGEMRSLSAIKRAVVDSFEKSILEQTLMATEGNVTRASERLGAGRTALQRLLKKHGINSQSFRCNKADTPLPRNGNTT
jgi:DNA-binding NtrC family response regulator